MIIDGNSGQKEGSMKWEERNKKKKNLNVSQNNKIPLLLALKDNGEKL